ncbi:MAG TPA: hypothetical protein PJ991_06495 [Kiritimatiellia bacterium]|nr:hypothetical protein [Kiritimatiellia bacterium]
MPIRSSLFKHAWIIQSAPPPPQVTPVDAAGGASVRFSPAWDLLCMQEFLLERTGHTCRLIDTRCYETIDAALNQLNEPPDPRATQVAVIHATQNTMESAAGIAAIIKKQYPHVITIMCGPLSTSFPEVIGYLPDFDFGLAGDSEVILRNLLEFLDIEHRLKLVPGLIIPGKISKGPHWVKDLSSLSLPEWYRIDWHPYLNAHNIRGIRVEARISRGHPGTRQDFPWPSPDEPFRIWPLQPLAQLMQKCSGHGISEIFFTDPPGCWTTEALTSWNRHLKTLRNTQPWAFQMMPRHIPVELMSELAGNACRRIEFIIPSCNDELCKKLGIELTDRELMAMFASLKKLNINPQIKYWVHGPGEAGGEVSRLLQHIRSMGYPSLSIYPFPLHHDSLLYRELHGKVKNTAPFSSWIEWAQHPDQSTPPPPCWGGATGVQECNEIIQTLHRKLKRNPWRKLKRMIGVITGKRGSIGFSDHTSPGTN